MSATTDQPSFAPPRLDALPEARLAFYLRLALSIAMLSVAFEKVFEIEGNLHFDRHHLIAATVGFIIAPILVLFERASRIAIAIFAVSIFVYVGSKWAAYHNHGWLTVWTIPVAAAFGWAWWRSELYRWYLRATLGVVMLAAAAQKLVAGTYIDGSYITYLSLHGTPTEQMFDMLCGPAAATGSCAWHKFLGTFIVLWQIAVGVLLLMGLRTLLFLFVEIAFLLGAGIYADEMNFQVLNIALLTIAFGYGMRPWLCALCLGFLVLDAVTIEGVLAYVF